MRRASLSTRIYAGALIGLVVLFSAVGLAATAFRQAAVSSGENRMFAQLPGWPRSLAEWESFPQRFDDYFNDHFGLRKLLLRLNTNINALMLGRLPSDRVILGRDDWLFYAGEESLELYANKRPLSGAQLDDARESLARRVEPGEAARRRLCADHRARQAQHLSRTHAAVSDAARRTIAARSAARRRPARRPAGRRSAPRAAAAARPTGWSTTRTTPTGPIGAPISATAR